MAATTKEEYQRKWGDFFDRGFKVWDTGEVASQLVEAWHGPRFGTLRAAARSGGSDDAAAGDPDDPRASSTRPLRTCEVGCATGASVRWLAAQGCEALGVDLVPGVIGQARSLVDSQRLQDEGGQPAPLFVAADVFELPTPFSYASVAAAQGVSAAPQDDNGGAAFDFVFDSQCFHVLRVFSESACPLPSPLTPHATLHSPA